MAKRRGEANTLLWKADVDFVRLAARCRAVIVPFGALGGDDAFDLFMDTDEILRNPFLGPFARAVASAAAPSDAPPLEDAVLPITTIPGTPLPAPVPLSNLGRVYFKFGPPLDAAALDIDSAAACEAAYAEVRARVEGEISTLQRVRAEDPERGGLGRLTGSAGRVWQTVATYGR